VDIPAELIENQHFHSFDVGFGNCWRQLAKIAKVSRCHFLEFAYNQRRNFRPYTDAPHDIHAKTIDASDITSKDAYWLWFRA